MNSSSLEGIIDKIKALEPFEGTLDDGSISIHIEEYSPFVCTAIHAGHNLRDSLVEKCALTEQERWYEEDPFTDLFIQSLPLRIVAHDSRYEYDLNRSEQECIYEDAWGKKVWDQELSNLDRQVSIRKHRQFYKLMGALLETLQQRFQYCVVYDIHSYNYKRIEKNTPVFNLGSNYIKGIRKQRMAEAWLQHLSSIDIPHITTTALENSVFQGKGYLAEFIAQKFPKVLSLPTEIKKIYCDEDTGDSFPAIVEALRMGLKEAIASHAQLFSKGPVTAYNKASIFTAAIDPNVKKTDDILFRICRNMELLEYVNPVNIQSEKKRFFASKFNIEPQFRYRPLRVDPFEFKEQLYRIPFEKIVDPHLFELYKSIIESQASQIDLLSSRGSMKFRYNSLRYFGEPTLKDLNDAKWILHSPDDSPEEANISVNDALPLLKKFIEQYNFPGSIDIVRNSASKAIFLISKKTLKLKAGAMFSSEEIHRLGHHEVGVHMLTTYNAIKQPLKILQTGFPVYTVTQEGLATAAEYFTGHMSLGRLKELAIRVIAVHSMVRGQPFAETFCMLVDQYQLDTESAYYVCVRAYRGGGLTKDYLYLRGFKNVVSKVQAGVDIRNLLLGKTSMEYLDLLNELVDRGMLVRPHYVSEFLKNKASSSEVLDFLVKGICA